MFNAPRTSSVRRLVFTVITAAAYCSMATAQAQAQVTGNMEGLSGIELAPGETIVKSIDEQSGMPVPMFNAQTNKPIVGSSVAGRANSSTAGHAEHGPNCGCSNCSAGGGVEYGCFGGCEPGCYLRAETLFMRRTGDERLSLSRDFRLDEFDHEFGTRITFGRTCDCTDGYEATFTGLFEWDLAGQRGNPAGAALLDPPGVLRSLITSAPAPNQVNVDVFDTDNNVFQSQTYKAEYNSFEVNRTSTGWDVVRLLTGIRYINYSENYRYSVIDNATGPNRTGFLQSDVNNDLIGGQVGLDMGYPLGERLWSMIRARGGVFANLSDGTFRLDNDSNTEVNNIDDARGLAGLIEFGTTLRYQLGDALSISGGYELWYLANVATAPAQFTSVMSPTVGAALNNSDDIFMHGAVFGIELTY